MVHLAMPVGIGHPKAADGVTFEIEFDHHHRLVAHDPPVMARFDRHDLRSPVFHHTAIGVFDVDFTTGQEADVGVHAQVGPDRRFHVDRPAESHGIDHAFDASGASSADLEPDVPDVAALGSLHWGE